MFQFRVLGSLDLRGQGGEEVLSVLAQPKRTALLAYLAVASPLGFHRRDKLAGLFWPEVDQEHARTSLRGAVHFLRRSLGEEAVLSRGDEEIGLDWGHISCDAAAFKRALETGDQEGALELYGGDLLEGFFLSGCPGFERWLEGERERLRGLAAKAGWEVANRHLEEGRTDDAERAGKRALALGGADENRTREFIQALAEAGARPGAIRFYERYEQVLWETLELEPSAETRALVEKVRGSESRALPPSERTAQKFGLPDSAPPPAVPAEGPPAEAQPPGPAVLSGDLPSLIHQELGQDLEILRKIGGGGGAEVFVAKQKPLDRLVAVKVLSRDLSRDPVARVRFDREARAAASLQHPNVVAVYRFGWLAREVPFLVMQYVNGPTLEEKLAAEGPLSIPAAKKVLAQIAAGLAEAHRKGFVHRDVSPANVLCEKETDRVLLTDFGLAGLLPHREVSLPRVTKKGEILGSPGYGSPEQLRGEDPTEGTDIYALGVLGYEILTGEGPFRAKTVADAAAAHLGWTPRPLVGIRPDIDAELSDLLGRCLAKDPGRRPSAEYLVGAMTKESIPEPEGVRIAEGEDVLRALVRRRFLRTLAIAGVIGLGSLYIIRMLVHRDLLSEKALPFALDTVLCGWAAASVLAWFHGEKGRQKVAAFEVILLAVVGLVWLAVGIAILVP